MDFKDQYGKILLIGIALLLAFVAYKRSHTHDPVVTSVDSSNTASAVLSNDEVENIVKDYILKHPEVVIESIEKMQKRKIQEMQAKTSVILKNVKGELENDKISPTIGDGSVTIMMVYDYNCNYCKKANIVLDKILATNEDVRVIYKPYPILSESSEYMTKVILAVNKLYPDQFKPVHSAFMSQKIGSRDDVIKILENYKVSVENVEAEFESAEIKDSLTKLGRIATTLKIQGVPVFIIGNELYPGMLEEKALNEIIANNLPKKTEAVEDKKPEVKAESPAKPDAVEASSMPAAPPVPSDEAQPAEQKQAPASTEELKLPPLDELEGKKDNAPDPAKEPANTAPATAAPEVPAPAAAPKESESAPVPKAPEAPASDMQKEQKEVKDQLSEEFSKFMNENALEEDGSKKEAAKTKAAK